MKQIKHFHVNNRAELIDHLVFKNGFKKIAPHSLLFQNKIDTVFVYIIDEVDCYSRVIVTHDGREVKNSFNNLVIHNSAPEHWENAFQEILNKF